MLRLLGDLRFCVLLGAVIALAGCGGGEEGGDAGGDSEKPAATDNSGGSKAIKQVDVSKLPKVEPHLPPQDNGRVEPAGPEGWKAAGRTNKYVAQFSLKTGDLPRVDILAADSPLLDVRNMSADNAADVAVRLEKEPLKNSKGETIKRSLLEPFKPIKIGDRYWVRHVRKTKAGQTQALQTIVAGRMYTVELLVSGEEAADLLKARDFGYTVAANLKFSADVPAAEFKIPTETPPPAENPTP